MKFGAQTYAWQMSGKYRGKIPHILEMCRRAGFEGLEIETSMLGEFAGKPEELKKVFDERGMTLAAIGVPVGWGMSDRKELLSVAETSFLTAEAFGETVMSLSLIPPEKPFPDKREEQKRFLEFLEELGERAKRAGHRPSFHTNSSPTSLFRDREDYGILEAFFQDTGMGFTPDAGHIAHGGMDVKEIFRKFMPCICHVHFKDMEQSGTWAPMGEGAIPFPALLGELEVAGYGGWVLVEEESGGAATRPDEVMAQNGRYIQHVWKKGI